jgi:hypothetical protein
MTGCGGPFGKLIGSGSQLSFLSSSHVYISQARWATKKHQELRLHPNVNYSKLQLTTEECLEVLKRRRWPVTEEDTDLQELVQMTSPPLCSWNHFGSKW